MSRKEFEDSSDAMVIVVWFNHEHSQSGFCEFSGKGDIVAKAMAFKRRMYEAYPDRSAELIINGAAIEQWSEALTNSAEYQQKGWKKFLGKFHK
jgi:hypothetical protein